MKISLGIGLWHFLPAFPAGISVYFTPAPAPIQQIEDSLIPTTDLLLSSASSPASSASAYQAVVEALAAAEKNIYLAVYEFNIYHLSEVLRAKLQAGVKVILLVEADNLKLPETYFLLDRLYRAGATIIPDQKKGGIMHNKFAVIDGKTVITGSANYSVNAFFQQYNDVVVIDNPQLAKKYLLRFTELTEKIYRKKPSPPSLEPEIIPDLSDPKVSYQAVFSRSIFNPTQILVNQVNTCKKGVVFLIFAFSSMPITQAMKDCLNKKVQVTGIFDNAFESENITKNWGKVPFQILWDAGAKVKYDNVKEKIHHKNMVINSDTVITGSFNFSANAQKNNDENFLIIHSSSLAKQYLGRFQELWKKFPGETLFEQYIRDHNQKKTDLSFNDYEKKYQGNRISAVKKEMSRGIFRGRIAVVEDGNTVTVELDKSRERITVILAGITAPLFGNHKHHQLPQAHLAKEGLIFLAAQREVTGKVLAGEGFKVHALLFLSQDAPSINTAMLKAGLVYPLFDETSSRATGIGDIPSLSYQKHPGWLAELPRLQEALKQAQKERRVLWGEFPLKLSPLKFAAQLEDNFLSDRLKENQYSLGKFEWGVWIGNRKTRKVYPPNSPTYMEYLKDLADQKLIFFKTVQDAEAAGYFPRNEKDY